MSGRRRAITALVVLVLALGLIMPAAVVGASPTYKVVASGLHSPRGLSFGPGGILYAAESGDATHAGRIIQIRNAMSQHPTVRTIVDNLVTFGDEGEFIGIDGISVRGRGKNQSIYGIMGLSPQATGDTRAGDLIKVSVKGSVQTVAPVGEFMYDWTDAHSGLWEEFPDSNPYGVLAVPGHIYVTDAGANTLNEVHANGTIDVLTYFPNTVIRDAIPTCVAKGPDGALYVGTLVLVESVVIGPSAMVYRVDPSDVNLADPTDPTKMSVWASGLWPINGCTFGRDGNFYASQMFTNPAHDFEAVFGDPQGDVVKIPFNSPTTHTLLAGGSLGLTAGVAVAPNGTVFVADGTAFAPSGRIVRLTRH